MPDLSGFTLALIYSLGLRWCAFKYIKLKPLREWVRSLDIPLANELLHCPYCQTIQASTGVHLALWAIGWEMNWAQAVLGVLANGWICLLIEAMAEEAIARMETLYKTEKSDVHSGNS